MGDVRILVVLVMVALIAAVGLYVYLSTRKFH